MIVTTVHTADLRQAGRTARRRPGGPASRALLVMAFAAHLGGAAAAQSADAPERSLLCDIEACSERYRSFRASDCTFQPFEGDRRLCAIAPPAPELAPDHDEPAVALQTGATGDEAWGWARIAALSSFAAFAAIAIGRVFLGQVRS